MRHLCYMCDKLIVNGEEIYVEIELPDPNPGCSEFAPADTVEVPVCSECCGRIDK